MYSFEYANYDGGVIEYSISGGAWTDAGSLIINNGYNGTISTNYDNPLAGRNAFVGRSNGYMSTRLNLATLSGQNVKFRFRIGTDTDFDDLGWFIDDIRIYTCVAATCSGFDFNEDFNDGVADNWVTDGSGTWSVTGGNYRMTGNGADTFRGSQYNADYCDFVYQAKVRKTAGTTFNPMGLFFRSNHPNPYAPTANGYLFVFVPDGEYSLWKRSSGSETQLIGWTSSAFLNTGLNVWNILKAEARGSTIKIYANGNLLATVNDSTYPSGKLGVAAYDHAGAPFSTVEYDFVTSDIIKKTSLVDFDGDGKTDIAVYRTSSGAWYVYPSGGGAAYGFGWGGDVTDKPATGDYDGDGKTDIAVYRAATGAWYVSPSGGGSPYGFGWGGDASDKPAPGDYDGDGKTDIAVYRASTGAWYVYPSGGGVAYGFGWGGDATDKPVPGDYDGDGKTDIAVYRAGTGAWYVYPSGGGAAYGLGWGGDASDKPAPGDFDGDGKTDCAVYRTSTGAWYVYPSGGGAPYGLGWGGDASDKPVTTNLSSID